MPTIIDSLIVSLGLDSTEFKKGADQATKAQDKLAKQSKQSVKEISEQEKKLAEAQMARAKEWEARGKVIAQGIGKMRNEALALFAVFTAGKGLEEFVVGTIKTEAALARTSSNLDISAEDLAKWQLAAKNAGGTAEGMTAQLKQSADAVAKLKIGQGLSDDMQMFLQFGARYGATNKAFKDGNTYLLARADIIAKIAKNEGPAIAAYRASQMGISGDEYNLIKLGSAEIEKRRGAMSGLAKELADNSAQAEILRQKMDALEDSFQSSATKILTVFTPAIKTALDGLKGFADWLASQNPASPKSPKGATAKPSEHQAIRDLQDLLHNRQAGEVDPKTGKTWVAGVNGRGGHWADTPGGNKVTRKWVTYGRGGHWVDVPQAGVASAAPAATPVTSPAAAAARGVRNNNPGNIKYGRFAVDHGATRKDADGFAIFPSMSMGQTAMEALLGSYLSSGSNTIRKAISKWAPATENDTAAYIAAVSKQMGIGADQSLTSANIAGLSAAIGRHENGASYASMAAILPARAAAAQAPRGNSSTSNTDVKVGTINVNTQAKDAVGIAKAIGGAVSEHSFVSQANAGVS
jgi:hypothetical protein